MMAEQKRIIPVWMSAPWVNVLMIFVLLSAGGLLLQGVFHIPVTGFIKDLFYMKYLPDLEGGVNFGILLVFGLLTSIHCVGMCGGLVLSQSLAKSGSETEIMMSGKKKVLLPSAFYNSGRLISYTLIGGLIGGLGQTLALSGIFKGLIPIIGGVFMILMAVNMLGIFAGLRRLHFGLPKGLLKKLGIGKPGYRSPFILGLLTGLMPCGPMQIVQIYALGTKSILIGALSMMVFALGTMPGLFGFGVLGSYISKNASKALLRISAMLVAILGVIMLTRGLALLGVQVIPVSPDADYVKAQIHGSVQTVSIEIESDRFPAIEVYEGIPVEWTIHAAKEDINDCNNEIVVPKYNLDIKLAEGDTLTVFTPQEPGEYVYTCWMGMIKSKIKVIKNPDSSYISLSSTEGIPGANIAETRPCSMADTNSACADSTGPGQATSGSAAVSSIPTQSSILAQSSKTIGMQTVAGQNAAAAESAVNSNSQNTGETTAAGTAVSSAVTDPIADEVRIFTGYLIDTDCLSLYPDPAEETRTCLLMPSCAGSGYGAAVKDGAGNTVFYLIDGKTAAFPADAANPATGGQLRAFRFISENISENNRSVSVKGILTESYASISGQSYQILDVTGISF